MYVCACVRVCVRACDCMCVCDQNVCMNNMHTWAKQRVCLFVWMYMNSCINNMCICAKQLECMYVCMYVQNESICMCYKKVYMYQRMKEILSMYQQRSTTCVRHECTTWMYVLTTCMYMRNNLHVCMYVCMYVPRGYLRHEFVTGVPLGLLIPSYKCILEYGKSIPINVYTIMEDNKKCSLFPFKLSCLMQKIISTVK